MSRVLSSPLSCGGKDVSPLCSSAHPRLREAGSSAIISSHVFTLTPQEGQKRAFRGSVASQLVQSIVTSLRRMLKRPLCSSTHPGGCLSAAPSSDCSKIGCARRAFNPTSYSRRWLRASLHVSQNPDCDSRHFPQQTIGDAVAKESLDARSLMPRHHNGAIVSGFGFVDNRVGDIAFIPEFERDSINRKPGLPKAFQRLQQDWI